MQVSGSIPPYRLESLNARLERLQRKLAKLGLEPMIVTIGSEIVTPPTTENGRPFVEVPVTINQPVPAMLSGWRFVAKIEHDCDDSGAPFNMVLKSPEYAGDLPQHYRTDKATCDHCGLSRRRNETFVVSSKTEGLKRVGRTCLSDFLGGDDAANILATAEAVTELADVFGFEADDSGGYGGGCKVFDTKHLCKAVAAIIRLKGWRSRKAVEGTMERSTSDRLLDLFCKKDSDPTGKYRPTEQDIAEGNETYDWVMSIDPEIDNEYLYNLRALFARGYIPFNKVPLACSAVAAYQREKARIEAEKVRLSRPSVHVGTVGDKIGTGKGKQIAPFVVTVLRRHGVDGFYGLTTIVTMQDDTGNEYVWFKSGSLDDTIVVGGRVTVNGGTVKEHRLDKQTDRPVTVLTRTVLIPV